MVPTRWLVLTVRLAGGVDPGLVLDRLMALGATAVEEREGEFVTYFPPPGDPEARVAEIRARLDAVSGGPGAVGGNESVQVGWGWQPHEEWSETWWRGLAPRRIGRRLLVAPTWMEPDPGLDDLVIRIDPGMAFGTAEHATTRGCLRLVEEIVEAGDRVVDVGAGTGILSIAAALLGAEKVIAADSDEFACEAARENAEANGVGDRIRIVQEPVDGSVLASLGPADGVMANIQSGVLLTLLEGARRALRPGGWLVLGGILGSERDEIVGRAGREGLALEAEICDADGVAGDEEWWSGRFRSEGS